MFGFFYSKQVILIFNPLLLGRTIPGSYRVSPLHVVFARNQGNQQNGVHESDHPVVNKIVFCVVL